MPFYQCISLAGSLSQEQKEEIAREVTRIHCQETGGLPLFVQIQFDEVTSGNVF
jgi:phenylpyruvate tautomerase PptA (4-oxalocrotonate tautomerase family)